MSIPGARAPGATMIVVDRLPEVSARLRQVLGDKTDDLAGPLHRCLSHFRADLAEMEAPLARDADDMRRRLLRQLEQIAEMANEKDTWDHLADLAGDDCEFERLRINAATVERMLKDIRDQRNQLTLRTASEFPASGEKRTRASSIRNDAKDRFLSSVRDILAGAEVQLRQRGSKLTPVIQALAPDFGGQQAVTASLERLRKTRKGS